MKNRILRILAAVFAFCLLAIPTVLVGQKIIERFISPTKTMFTELETEDEEMDLPNGSRANKDEYLRLRDEQIALMRGLPLPKGNERTTAIKAMENQESALAARNFAPAAASWRYLGPSPIPVTVPTSGRVSALRDAGDPTTVKELTT